MRKVDPNKIRIVVVLLIGCFLISAGLFSAYRNHKNIQMLKSMEIYEVAFSYVQIESRTEAHYMICDPPNDVTSIQEKVDSFLIAENTLNVLKLRSEELTRELSITQEETQSLVGMNIVFLEPSKDLDIGDFPEDIYDSKYRMGEHRLLTVSVTFISDDEYDIEYLWPRKVT